MSKEPSLVKSVRFMLSIVCFFLNAILYMQRVNLSVAIVCMVNKINCNIEQNKSISLSDNSKFSIGNQSLVSYHGNQNSTICSVISFIYTLIDSLRFSISLTFRKKTLIGRKKYKALSWVHSLLGSLQLK